MIVRIFKGGQPDPTSSYNPTVIDATVNYAEYAQAVDKRPFPLFISGVGAEYARLLYPIPGESPVPRELGAKIRDYFDTQARIVCQTTHNGTGFSGLGKKLYKNALFLCALAEAGVGSGDTSKIFSIRKTLSRMLNQNRMESALACIRAMQRTLFPTMHLSPLTTSLLSDTDIRKLREVKGYVITLRAVGRPDKEDPLFVSL